VAEFIKPIVENVLAVLKDRTPGELGAREPFVEYGTQFTGVVTGFPALWVMPVRSEFDAESQGYMHEAHQITVTFGVTGSEPGEVTDAAMAYMKAIDAAIQASWPADGSGLGVMRIFVRSHDYGPLLNRGGVLARFPELDLVVETAEAA